jgi:hypothetical protein
MAAPKKYLTNASLLEAVIKSKKAGQMSNELALMLMLLSKRIASKSNFANYSYKEDMIAEAMCNLAKHALKFDENKSNNPFAFYTSAIMHSFYQFLNTEKKHRNIRDTILLEEGYNASFGFMESGGENDGGESYRHHIDPNFVPLKVQTGKKKKKEKASDTLLDYSVKGK